jgi:hypothetical protein
LHRLASRGRNETSKIHQEENRIEEENCTLLWNLQPSFELRKVGSDRHRAKPFIRGTLLKSRSRTIQTIFHTFSLQSPYLLPRFSITRSLTQDLLTEDWIRFEKTEPKFGDASCADYATVVFGCDLIPDLENIISLIIGAHTSSRFLKNPIRNEDSTLSCPN